MAQEIELKLSLPQAYQCRFAALDLLQKYASAAVQIKALHNSYFDTPGQQLNQHAAALRVRRQGEQYIQTLKTRGSSQGGLHQRPEWEWTVPSAALDLALLPPQALPDGVRLDALAIAFATDFERSCWMLSYPFAGKLAQIELVLDVGAASSGDQRDSISEIELELKSGPTEALFALALELATQVPLRVSRISKAQRGYRLLRPEQARRIPAAPPLLPAVGEQFALNTAQQWLERLQGVLEAYAFSADRQLLAEAPGSFAGLRQQLELAPQVPAELRQRLTAQQQVLSELLSAPDNQAQIQAWLDDLELGLCLLTLSRWLYQQR
ncbi:MAG: triphosphatase [Motiliproteus sp.]|jgi:triphosphatase